MAYAPTVAREDAQVLRVPIPEEERQLELLARSARKLCELQKWDPLVVLVDLRPIRYPFVAPPAGHGGKRFTAKVMHVRPSLQANRRADPEPHTATIREQGGWRAHSFSGREVHIMRGHEELSSSH